MSLLIIIEHVYYTPTEMPHWAGCFGGFLKYFPETGKAEWDKYNSDVNYNYYWHECYKRFAFFFYKNQKVFFNCLLVSVRFTHTKYQPVFSIPFLIWQWPFDKCYPSWQSTCSVAEWAPTSWRWRIQSLSVQSIWCNWNPGTENYNNKNPIRTATNQLQ